MNKYKANYIDLVRFVAIYAVILGHFHPFVSETDMIGRQIIYLFHMPVFFMVSGMLSKPKAIKLLAYSLLIPYLLYNAISIIHFDFLPIITLDALKLVNSPTWFFAVLFGVKIVADKINYLLIFPVSLVLFVFVVILHYIGVDPPRFLCINALIYGFVFFAVGGVFLHYIETLSIVRNQCIVYIATIAMDIWVCINYDRFDMYLAKTYNPIIYLISSLLTSVSVLLVCKQIFSIIPSLVHNFIITISRGTMLIVGTHYVLLIILIRLLPSSITISFGLKMIITIFFLIIYYGIIKYTFKWFPILYGKRR